MTALTIGYLADRPDVGPILADWFEHEWGDGSPQRSAAAYSAQLAQCFSRDRLPVCLVGFLDEEPVATATLKFREIEFSAEADFWLGWVCVRQNMRGRGFGGALVAAAESQAAALGLSPLYLHTPSAEAFYLRLGWQTIGTTIAEEKLTVVMARTVSPRSTR